MANSKTENGRAAPPPDRTSEEDRIRPGALIADIAVREGSILARRMVQKRLARAGIAGKGVAKQGLGKRIAAIALARLASRSVPGTILVGSGFVAKALYDRRKQAKAAETPGSNPEAVEEGAE